MRGLPRLYWLLWTGMLINRLSGFVALYLSLYLTGPRGLSTSVAGLVVGAYGIGGAAGTLAGGVLADRWGRRPTILTGQFTAVAVVVGLVFAHSAPLIAVCAGLLGIGHSMPNPALVAAIVDVVPEPGRTRAFNLQFWAMNLGLVGASLLAGALAEVSYPLMFSIDAAATLATALLLLWKVPETRPSHVRHEAGSLRTPLTDGGFMAFVGLTLLLAVVTTQTSTMLPIAMHGDGLRPSNYGLVTAYVGLLIVAGQLFVPRLIGDRRKATVLAIANLFLGAGFAVVAGVDRLPGYLAAATVWTIGSMLAAPPNAAVIAELSPAALRGRYQSVFFLTFPAANFIAPAAGGVSLQYLGDWHWVLCGVLGLVAAVGHLLIGPARERRLERPYSAASMDATPETEASEPSRSPAAASP